MGRVKRKSVVVERAKKRQAGLESISTSLDLGNGRTLVNYIGQIQTVETALDAYNQILSQVDAALNLVQTEEKKLREESDRMLSGVGSFYGYDSDEYEKAGGKRKSERKKPVRKKTDSGSVDPA